jgi:hypothetical protein
MGKKIEGEDTKETKKMCDVLTNMGFAIIQAPVFLQTFTRRCWASVMLLVLLTAAQQQNALDSG